MHFHSLVEDYVTLLVCLSQEHARSVHHSLFSLMPDEVLFRFYFSHQCKNAGDPAPYDQARSADAAVFKCRGQAKHVVAKGSSALSQLILAESSLEFFQQRFFATWC